MIFPLAYAGADLISLVQLARLLGLLTFFQVLCSASGGLRERKIPIWCEGSGWAGAGPQPCPLATLYQLRELTLVLRAYTTSGTPRGRAIPPTDRRRATHTYKRGDGRRSGDAPTLPAPQ